MKKSEESSSEGIDPYDEEDLEKIRSSSESPSSLNSSIRKSPNLFQQTYPGFDYSRDFQTDDYRTEIPIIVKEIREKNLPFPLIRYIYSKEQVREAFEALKVYKPNLIERSHHELKGHSGSWWLPSLFRGRAVQFVTKKNDWWKIDMAVDYFTEYERIRARKEYDNSMEDDWYNDEQLEKAILNCVSKGTVNAENLREAMFYVGRELTLFRVSKTKAFVDLIFEKELPVKGKRWLDMSAGWGDRVYTACALEMNYLGFDPNTFLKQGHEELIGMFGNGKQRIIYEPFEKSEKIVEEDVKRFGLFDLALTSPPFYIIERYNGENQSVDSYPEFEDWMVKFLFKSLSIIWNNLKEGGYLAINIANIRNTDMVGPMQLFIEDFLPGSSWEGIITFSGRGTQSNPGAIYIWKKVAFGKPMIRWNPIIKRSLRELFPKLHRIWIEFSKDVKK